MLLSLSAGAQCTGPSGCSSGVPCHATRLCPQNNKCPAPSPCMYARHTLDLRNESNATALLSLARRAIQPVPLYAAALRSPLAAVFRVPFIPLRTMLLTDPPFSPPPTGDLVVERCPPCSPVECHDAQSLAPPQLSDQAFSPKYITPHSTRLFAHL